MAQDLIKKERDEIVRGGKFHAVHWGVLSLSLVLTFFAWHFSNSQVKEKSERSFLREADRTIEMISERMGKYEDGLQSGVSCIKSHKGRMSYQEWISFSKSLKIEIKYPGINGIGVIHHVEPEHLEEYLDEHQKDRPGFKVHPEHEEDEYWPITYIIPVEINTKAVGLDIAHETNRRIAAQNSRDSGKPKITGPIVLVQDDERTAGFLFYAPFYDGESNTVDERQENIIGLVYAPFVVKKLMDGTLKKDRRHVMIRITDGTEVIFDEHQKTVKGYDPNPLYTKQFLVDMYGRTWLFDVSSDQFFRDSANSNQPLMILMGGIFIDSMLLVIFLLLIKSNKRAIVFADRVEAKIRVRNEDLREKNKDLETLLHVSSHDLREPLRAIKNFSNIINVKYSDKLDDKGKDLLFRIERGSKRLDDLIDDVLKLSYAQRKELNKSNLEGGKLVEEILESLEDAIDRSNATIDVSDELPYLYADKMWASQAIFNIINNAVKFTKPNEPPQITISPYVSKTETGIVVEDRGIGIEEECVDRIFNLFQREVSRKVEGTGAGLAIVRQVALRHEGQAYAEPRAGGGSRFVITFSKEG
jgi:signal transduction histidine kinase